MTFGEKLRKLRLEKEMTISQVANLIGINPRAYNYYEQGLREPSLLTFKLICLAYDVSADYLLGIVDFY